MGQLTKICLLAATTMSIGAAHASPWPTGTQDTATAVYNEEITIPVLDNDSGEGLKLVSVNAWSTNLGRAVITEDNKIQYKQVGHIRGDISDEFWYVFEDEQGRTNAAKVVVSVSQEVVVSTPWPTAALDSVTIIRDEAITVDVLSNDTGEGLELTASNDWTNKGGRTVIVDNQVRYAPPSSFIGTDWFWYNFKDNEGRTNSQKVIVKVTPPPSAYPRANPDAVESKNGLRVFIPVLDNDTGEGLKLTTSNDWTKEGGRTVIVNDTIRYTPPADFNGTDSFWYNFEDSQGRTNSTKVTVDVTQNTEFSVVEFCGNTYQTDGTKENTILTSLTPRCT